jgi:hypothetical protein
MKVVEVPSTCKWNLPRQQAAWSGVLEPCGCLLETLCGFLCAIGWYLGLDLVGGTNPTEWSGRWWRYASVCT